MNEINMCNDVSKMFSTLHQTICINRPQFTFEAKILHLSYEKT